MVPQVDSLSIILYRITLFPTVKEIFAEALGLLAPFYLDNAAFYGPSVRIARLMILLLDQGHPGAIFWSQPSPSLYAALLLSRGRPTGNFQWRRWRSMWY